MKKYYRTPKNSAYERCVFNTSGSVGGFLFYEDTPENPKTFSVDPETGKRYVDQDLDFGEALPLPEVV
jgi:hypothetical protein